MWAVDALNVAKHWESARRLFELELEQSSALFRSVLPLLEQHPQASSHS